MNANRKPVAHLNVRLQVPDELQELVIGELLDYSFEAFEQQEALLSAWISPEKYGDALRERLQEWLSGLPEECRILSEERVEERNWNEEWEKTIRPQTIGSFHIHPTWTDEPVPADKIAIAIDPKMAFGTGYHETTRLLLHLLPGSVAEGDKVLDMGTGTGILAIGALKLGASEAVGIDLDPWCYDNANENAALNRVAGRLAIRIGSSEQIQDEERFDLILANINRNVLLDLGDELTRRLAPGGRLLLSGILEGDRTAIMAHPAYASLECTDSRQENEWLALVLKKS
ncbi:50S ribosomal protein L11 methyltransferase [Balneolales bacterium ANBcel1]|nr:50S ribosomal protein L11 methyltransferase [Balneolales bacterium ANBcel1]